jgi:hypothetical protein
MTAEVALLNREAVALAADSAVTIGAGNQQKIFPSAQKLFPLSYRYPVGIMFYNNATLAGVPLETIVKAYRSERANVRFDRLKEHAEDFLDFLHSDRRLFSDAQQEHFFVWSASELFRSMRERIDNRVMRAGPDRTADQLGSIVEEVVRDRIESVQGAPELETVRERLHPALLLDRYGEKTRGVLDFAFRELPLSDDLREELLLLPGELFVRDSGHEFPEWTGLVVAGFGYGDFVPALQHYRFEGVVADVIRYHVKEFVDVDFGRPANIVPFAQSDGVKTFLDGADPRYAHEMQTRFRDALETLARYAGDAIEEIDARERPLIDEKFRELIPRVIREQEAKLGEFRQREMSTPVLNVVSALPKDELADMAEALVNLTALKRRISIDAETVGGPVDVAVISKGDGFVWIKRKDYYEPTLNVYAPRSDVDEALGILRNLGGLGGLGALGGGGRGG